MNTTKQVLMAQIVLNNLQKVTPFEQQPLFAGLKGGHCTQVWPKFKMWIINFYAPSYQVKFQPYLGTRYTSRFWQINLVSIKVKI